ncbi:uncharacterized protein LOC129584330 [Paramacrobiotus metropolitanus]|uniref:uncharacterized protein LOC129584330 n=1 Tax=Paramacrobiotus metropolitanus TaxID=2943436 RepID=UPI0024459EE6|nr:uncharacterized protein LOC129584330 [Paramacrobiotus metropolitanus]
MSELRLGVEIGFKKISIAQYENGVPRVLLSFPSVAACSNDHHDWHFGMDARSYRADSRYQSLPSIKGTLLAYGCGEKDPLLPLLLEKLFAYIKMIGETERKQCLRGVVVVLPHGLNCSPVIRQLVMDAWQKNSVMDVLCISDVSAILLAYTVQTLDRQSINTNASEPVHLLVCNADSEHCRVDVFEVIQNNHLVKFHSGQYVVWKCFARLRRHLVNAVFQHFKRAGMPELDQRMLLQLEEECVDQMALFNDPRTEKVTIRAPLQKYVMICTRKTYHAVAESSVEVVRKRVVAELTRFGLMDANTGNIKGNCGCCWWARIPGWGCCAGRWRMSQRAR